MEWTDIFFGPMTYPSLVGRSIPLGLPIGLWLWTSFIWGWTWQMLKPSGHVQLEQFFTVVLSVAASQKAGKLHWLCQSFPWPCFCDAPRLRAGDLLQPPQQMRPSPQPSARTSHCQRGRRALGCRGAHCTTGEAAISASRAGWRWEGNRWLGSLSTPMLVDRITAWSAWHRRQNTERERERERERKRERERPIEIERQDETCTAYRSVVG